MAATPTTKTLWIAKTALMQMRNLANEHTPLETGGALVGYEAENLEVVVTDVIGPGPHAKHRRLRFRPDYDYQQAQLDRHFAQTQGREFYLGDWHTHPSGACSLSWRDKRVLLRIAKTPSSGTKRPIMAVLADGQPEWNLHASRLITFRKGSFPKMELLELLPQVFASTDT